MTLFAKGFALFFSLSSKQLIIIMASNEKLISPDYQNPLITEYQPPFKNFTQQLESASDESQQVYKFVSQVVPKYIQTMPEVTGNYPPERDDLRELTIRGQTLERKEGGLNSEIRYKRYQAKHITPQQWRQELGPDMVDGEHLIRIGQTVPSFAKANNYPSKEWFNHLGTQNLQLKQYAWLDIEDISALELLGYFHDVPELYTSDKTFDHQTLSFNDKQTLIMSKLSITIIDDFEKAGLLSKENNHGIDLDLPIRLLLNKVSDILSKRNKPLAALFDAIEISEYLESSLEALKAAIKNKDFRNPEIVWLIENVFGNQITKLVQTSENRHKSLVSLYPYMFDLAYKNATSIQLGFYLINELRANGVYDFQFYKDEGDKTKKKLAFDAAWENWQQSNFYRETL